MADSTNQQGMPIPHGGPGSQQEYESPVFDLHSAQGQQGQAAAQPAATAGPQVIPDSGQTRFDPNAVPGARVKIGEETIPIAPHPTTNRFPWKPVQNPTVPVYGTVQQPEPLPPPDPNLVFEEVASEAPKQPPKPVEPEKPAVPEVPQPKPQPLPEPQPKPEPEPQPQTQAPKIEQQAVVEMKVATEPAPPTAAPLPRPTPTPPPQRPQNHRGTRIYSVSTREVWRVLRPATLFKPFVSVIIVAILAILLYVWMMSGGPSGSHGGIPFMDKLLGN